MRLAWLLGSLAGLVPRGVVMAEQLWLTARLSPFVALAAGAVSEVFHSGRSRSTTLFPSNPRDALSQQQTTHEK